MSDHQSMAAVNSGQRRSTMANHQSTTAGPPPDHRSTTVGRSVNGGQPLVNGGGQLGHGPDQ
ncbi:hypothetical protein Tco_0592099, partial [Tanacetum coccineum]